jgi:hypothetical protein
MKLKRRIERALSEQMNSQSDQLSEGHQRGNRYDRDTAMTEFEQVKTLADRAVELYGRMWSSKLAFETNDDT